jgi:hypothetical protein
MLGRDNPCVGTERTLVLRPCEAAIDLELPIDENVFILPGVAILFGIYIIYSNSLKSKKLNLDWVLFYKI